MYKPRTSLRHALACAAGLALTASASAQQSLLTFESTADVGILLDPMDGSVTNPAFLDLTAAAAAVGYTGSLTPIEGIQVGDEIWVSDQLADRIWRFDLEGNFIDDLGVDLVGDGLLNNIRGIEVVGDTVYASLGNDSTTVNEGIATIDVPTLTVTGSFNGRDPLDTSYFDVHYTGTELLVANIDSGNDGIERYDLAGNFLGILFASDGSSSIDFPQQINADGANLLVAGFSPPSGIYSISLEGDDFGIVAALDAGPRAGYRLGNGEILWSNGTFLRTDSNIILDNGSFRFFSLIDFGGAPCPGDVADDFGSAGADGQVSFGDFLFALTILGPCPGGTPGCDFDIADDFGTEGADGQVSFGDFLFALTVLGPCP